MISKGIYPTMITPFKDGKIDYKNVEKLVEFYKSSGCHGIFAVCQSSEMHFLSLKERVELAKRVVEFADGKLNVIASGHCAADLEAQAEEANAISETGVDAFVLISNRFDLHNEGDDVFLENAEKLLECINPAIPLGIYECPTPYKRLLTERIISWCIKTNRFTFIKDTCCDPDMLSARLKQMKGTGFGLYNANAQTLLQSLKEGAAGYSGIMANFHPELLVWLFENHEKEPEKAQKLSDVLSMAAFTESPAYPCTAKYFLNQFKGFNMEVFSRSCPQSRVTAYQKAILEQLYRIEEFLKENLAI